MKIIKYVADTVKEKTTGGQKCPSDFMFYKYFYDKHDLVESVFKQELADPFFWDFTKNLQEREVLFLKHLAKNRSFYLNALKSADQNSFYDMWMELACSSLLGYFRSTEMGERLSEPDLVFVSKYLAYAWVNMNISWLRDADGMSAEEMEQKCTLMMERGLEGFKKKNASENGH